jgi:hypothetical protein
MKLVGIPRNSHFFFCLDLASYIALSALGWQAILIGEANFTSVAVNNSEIVEFDDILKVKPTLAYQILLWEVEVIVADADIVFLENPLGEFTDKADFEVQCDSMVLFRIPLDQKEVNWQVNLGFFKVQPKKQVLKLIPRWLNVMYDIPKI